MTDYVLSSERVSSAFWNLIERPIHQNFSGYLCLVWLANERDTESNLSWGKADYVPFFDRFFSVTGGPRPYLKPFAQNSSPDEDTIWFGSNLAGTYSTSTMQRSNTGISQVLTVEDTGHSSKVSLNSSHVADAKNELLDGQMIPAGDLAIYLYRNFTFNVDDDDADGDGEVEEPSVDDLVEIFKDEFGYDGSSGFDDLYTTTDEDGIFEGVDEDDD